MWNRREIKGYAKDFLRRHYWKAFLVCLIATLLSGGGTSNSSNTNYEESYQDDTYYYNEMNVIEELDNPAVNFATRRFNSPLFMLTGGAIGIMVLVLIILLVTVGFAIEVGQKRFFLRGFEGDARIKNLFSTFNSEEYLPIVKTQFLRGLYTILWTLLFIIPGIIKAYEYKFVPYILAEEPNLSSREVITMSREMTSGHKMDMFILDLSFIGWYLLGGLLFGIGGFFVDPYNEATYARLYNILSGNDELEEEYIDSDMVID